MIILKLANGHNEDEFEGVIISEYIHYTLKNLNDET